MSWESYERKGPGAQSVTDVSWRILDEPFKKKYSYERFDQ